MEQSVVDCGALMWYIYPNKSDSWRTNETNHSVHDETWPWAVVWFVVWLTSHAFPWTHIHERENWGILDTCRMIQSSAYLFCWWRWSVHRICYLPWLWWRQHWNRLGLTSKILAERVCHTSYKAVNRKSSIFEKTGRHWMLTQTGSDQTYRFQKWVFLRRFNKWSWCFQI